MKLLGERELVPPALARVAAEARARALGRAGRPGAGQARVSSRPDRHRSTPGAPPADSSSRQAARSDDPSWRIRWRPSPPIPTPASQLAPSRGCTATSASHGSRSAPSPCTSSTTTSSSRTPARRPPTTSSAASSRSACSSPPASSTAGSAPAHARPSRSSPASSACSGASRPCTTRERSGPRATTTPGCCRSSPGSC